MAEEVRAHGRQAGRPPGGLARQAARPRSTTATTSSSPPAPTPAAALGLDEAIERARLAAEVGVDAIFVEAPESVDELKAIADATPGCIRVANMIEGGKTPLRTTDELHDLGFDLIVSPLTGLLAAAKQMRTAYETLRRKGTLRDDLDLVTLFDDFSNVVDLDRHYATEARYASE